MFVYVNLGLGHIFLKLYLLVLHRSLSPKEFAALDSQALLEPEFRKCKLFIKRLILHNLLLSEKGHSNTTRHFLHLYYPYKSINNKRQRKNANSSFYLQSKRNFPKVQKPKFKLQYLIVNCKCHYLVFFLFFNFLFLK